VLAAYLYEAVCPGARALSAGLDAGDAINDRAQAMLAAWGIDAADHRPRQLDRKLCQRADAIFVMGPEKLARLLREYGYDLAKKCYLFADPFSLPESFANDGYLVYDPSFSSYAVEELVKQFDWFRERVVQIHAALDNGEMIQFVPAREYLDLLIG
jgi:protein-tyrosine-phosphatase